MKNDPDPAESVPPAPSVTAKLPRHRRAAQLLNATAVLATTALVIAVEPKLPPYKGD
ncbi:hypothetical protein [Lentzea tibetensis]|uniref:hypothetical protein n=1 Tax=Lentzea tibetensis TaxID=2591470 RepID=UPI001644FA6D|nr:hypothetical protein [Lentzea tibetensis]